MSSADLSTWVVQNAGVRARIIGECSVWKYFGSEMYTKYFRTAWLLEMTTLKDKVFHKVLVIG